MNSIKSWKTAQSPSTFGMPISGHAFGATTRATDLCTAAATLVVRDRDAVIGNTTGTAEDAALTQSYFPGNPAWRPPTC